MSASALPGMAGLVAPPADDTLTAPEFVTRRLSCGCVVEVPDEATRHGARLVRPCRMPIIASAYDLASREIPRGWLLDTDHAALMRRALNTIAEHVDYGLRARR